MEVGTKVKAFRHADNKHEETSTMVKIAEAGEIGEVIHYNEHGDSVAIKFPSAGRVFYYEAKVARKHIVAEKEVKTKELSKSGESKDKPLLKIAAYAVVNLENGFTIQVVDNRPDARSILQRIKRVASHSNFKIVKLKADKFVR